MALVGEETSAISQLPLVLQLDVAGNPNRWITYELSAYYYSKDRVAWSMGEVDLTIFGGTNAASGNKSSLVMNTILAIRGEVSASFNRYYVNAEQFSEVSAIVKQWGFRVEEDFKMRYDGQPLTIDIRW